MCPRAAREGRPPMRLLSQARLDAQRRTLRRRCTDAAGQVERTRELFAPLPVSRHRSSLRALKVARVVHKWIRLPALTFLI